MWRFHSTKHKDAGTEGGERASPPAAPTEEQKPRPSHHCSTTTSFTRKHRCGWTRRDFSLAERRRRFCRRGSLPPTPPPPRSVLRIQGVWRSDLYQPKRRGLLQLNDGSADGMNGHRGSASASRRAHLRPAPRTQPNSSLTDPSLCPFSSQMFDRAHCWGYFLCFWCQV